VTQCILVDSYLQISIGVRVDSVTTHKTPRLRKFKPKNEFESTVPCDQELFWLICVKIKITHLPPLINYFQNVCESLKIGIVGGGVQLGPLGTGATNRPIVPAPGDYDDGEIDGMIGRGEPAPVPLCPPHAARTRTRAAAVGSQRLTV
jgi:hypothetical protein